VSFKQHFEEKFAFTGSSSLSKDINFSWQNNDGIPGIWVGGFAYNFNDKAIENYPDLSSTPDEYFITHDLYSITLQDISKGDNPLEGFTKKYPNALKEGQYYWISFESYEYGSRTASVASKVARNARLIIQTVISALDQKLKPSDNVCFSADANDESRNSLYSLLARKYAKSTNKEVLTQKDGNEIIYLVH
jgi:hypothetical protein